MSDRREVVREDIGGREADIRCECPFDIRLGNGLQMSPFNQGPEGGGQLFAFFLLNIRVQIMRGGMEGLSGQHDSCQGI